ncbi:TBC domain-containing protein C4G8.04 [Tolypocladium ophioglossoides CBS 100239]|uniref:TBC domain-containing protein C4G8.04 n=1 Tax=Tolypocladium ophioglossoides (strain CBS 100239) TaxID=1163406 RepID=A0A0L0NKQ0_TOLOC|nr:TBC domain-containing protein C4G8.04 [Tolypocladium ophioglossoides CBS 100239]
MDAVSEAGSASQPLERSVSQQSGTSARSHRSVIRTSRNRRVLSQPSSSASTIAASDKSLTSFPSFPLEAPGLERFNRNDGGGDDGGDQRLKTATQESENGWRSGTASGRGFSIVDNLTGRGPARDALFEDAPLQQSIPGALHRADDEHIGRLVARHGAVALIRQIAEDLAQRDSQISALRRRADERERALKKIVRECGLSNLDLETRLRTVENDLRANDKIQEGKGGGLSDLMSDAMQDTMAASVYGLTDRAGSTIRAASASTSTNADAGNRGTMRGWKEYIWGSGTAKRASRTSSVNGDGIRQTTVVRSHSSMDRRPTLQEDLFSPPPEAGSKSVRSASRASSIRSGNLPEHKSSVSLASLALRLVAGSASATRDAEARGRAVSTSDRAESARPGSVASSRTVQSTRAVSVAGGPKALMAMRRATPAPQAPTASTKSQAQELWGNMAGSPPSL